jgi:hypothetical protein
MLPAQASPSSALDAPAEEVEPLIDVADPALVDRQAQAHRRENRPNLTPKRVGVGAGAVQQDPVLGAFHNENNPILGILHILQVVLCRFQTDRHGLYTCCLFLRE